MNLQQSFSSDGPERRRREEKLTEKSLEECDYYDLLELANNEKLDPEELRIKFEGNLLRIDQNQYLNLVRATFKR